MPKIERNCRLPLTMLAAAVPLFCSATASAQQGGGGSTCEVAQTLLPKGTELPENPICASLSPTLFGTRDSLNEKGISINGYLTYQGSYDVLGHNRFSTGPQTYNGQRWSSMSTQLVDFAFNLERYGWGENSQVVLKLSNNRTNYKDYAPSDAYVQMFAYYRTFNEGRQAFQVGYTAMGATFYGPTVGISQSQSVLGYASSVPLQLGLAMFQPQPSLDARFLSSDKSWYGHFGIGRSVNPDGFGAYADENPVGLKWHASNAKAVYIGEAGYRPAPSASRSVWIRAGAIHNESGFQKLDQAYGTPAADRDSNNAYYALADVQLTQPVEAAPYQGWYLNVKADKADEDRTVFYKDWGFTFYRIGTFASRPGDLFSLSMSRSYYSQDFTNLLKAAGYRTVDYTTTTSATYSMVIRRGIFLSLGLAYGDHPTAYEYDPFYNHRYRDTLSVLTSFSIAF